MIIAARFSAPSLAAFNWTLTTKVHRVEKIEIPFNIKSITPDLEHVIKG